ncbi:MAG: hypothetical protein ACHQ7M_04985 [Chloroflexota bacterium]
MRAKPAQVQKQLAEFQELHSRQPDYRGTLVVEIRHGPLAGGESMVGSPLAGGHGLPEVQRA